MTSPFATQIPVLRSLEDVYHFALANQLPIAVYRLPGEQEPVTILQTSQQLNILSNGSDAIGKDGFIIAPWLIQPATPVVFIKADHIWNGWYPAIGNIEFNGHEFVQPVPHDPEPIFETSIDLYQKQVTAIRDAIKAGTIEKAILSRIMQRPLPEGFDLITAFKKATAEYPEAFCYLVNLPGLGEWMGASPELLAKVKGNTINTVALAGTLQNNGQLPDHVKWGEKEQHEQRLVAGYIFKYLQQYCYDIVTKGPITVRAGNLFHIRTDFSAKLTENNHHKKLKSLLNNMHPTPAIAGIPKEAAVKLISAVEKHERAYYGGYLGPVKAEGDLEWFVNLRCMQVMRDKAFLYLGGGITSGSDPDAEWKETVSKAETLLNILPRE